MKWCSSVPSRIVLVGKCPQKDVSSFLSKILYKNWADQKKSRLYQTKPSRTDRLSRQNQTWEVWPNRVDRAAWAYVWVSVWQGRCVLDKSSMLSQAGPTVYTPNAVHKFQPYIAFRNHCSWVCHRLIVFTWISDHWRCTRTQDYPLEAGCFIWAHNRTLIKDHHKQQVRVVDLIRRDCIFTIVKTKYFPNPTNGNLFHQTQIPKTICTARCLFAVLPPSFRTRCLKNVWGAMHLKGWALYFWAHAYIHIASFAEPGCCFRDAKLARFCSVFCKWFLLFLVEMRTKATRLNITGSNKRLTWEWVEMNRATAWKCLYLAVENIREC